LLISTIVIVLLNIYSRVFPFNVPFFASKYLYTGNATDTYLKVMSINVNGSATNSNVDSQLCRMIRKSGADIVFLTEVAHDRKLFTDSLLKKSYPYKSYIDDSNYNSSRFYSKYPLSETIHIGIKSSKYSYCYCCQTTIGSTPIKVVGVHMASNNFKGSQASIRPENIDGVYSFLDYLGNIKEASMKRSEEANAIITQEDGYKSIIMGDFNDVCGSKPLNIFEYAGFKDAWWEGGFGYGATIYNPIPFRIDHILYNKGLELVDIKNVGCQGLSDHDALLATFCIN